ncbi:MAG: hypothetical protein GY929_15685 [Actinomycetia bacterium]|nr:hypothetical protein [Actinomycetes bacterium]
MPRYRCSVSGTLDDSARSRVENGLARIEAEYFDTDPADLLVEYTEVDPDRWFTAAQPSRAAVVTGTVPVGTTQEVRERLLFSVGRMISEAIDRDFDDVMVVASTGRRGR